MLKNNNLVQREDFQPDKTKVLTKDSKNLNDLKDFVPTKTFNDIAQNKTHSDFYCKSHMEERLLNYCNNDSLIDVVFYGLDSLKFSKVSPNIMRCKIIGCLFDAEYRIDRSYD